LVDRADDLPFEFIALEAVELEAEAYPLLDELTAKISTLDLERARRLKSKLVALTRRVQKVRDEIEQLMDDDGDMAEMYLTEKKMRMEASSLDEEGLQGIAGNNAFGTSVSAPVSPVSSPPAPRRLEKQFSFARSRHSSFKSSESSQYNIEELEMLLEAYFVVIDYTLSKLTSVQSMNCLLVSLLFSLISLLRNTLADNFAIYIPFSQLKEYIDDTEDFINIQLDNVRNQLIQFELLLTTATFVVAIFGVVSGVFGMNFEGVAVLKVPHAFEWTLIITGVCGAVIFACLLWYFKKRRFFPL
uniref:Magnesium transporter n=1 Tax=Aegilops tauschii subsp. strangulata TaxID=200361 RepID=A0A453CC03_AEGTS